jgi:hypothetical protein
VLILEPEALPEATNQVRFVVRCWYACGHRFHRAGGFHMTSKTGTGQSLSPDELRGWAARKNLAEDARWAADTVLSGIKIPEFEPYVGLLLSHHFVRIAYEGAIAIRSANPHVGVPQLAALLDDTFAQITAQARHLTKLLDNKKKSYADILSEFAAAREKHRNAFTGKAVRLARWLETDLGLYFVDGALVGATVPIGYRLGLDPEQSGFMWGANLAAITKEWGSALAVLSAAAFDFSEPTATLDLAAIRVIRKDRRAQRYVSGRFDSQLPTGLKLLILLIEGDLNTARLILPPTAGGHQSAEFRARAVTCYHCLSALKRICEQYPGLHTRGLSSLREILNGAPAQRLLSPTGEKIRNRSVHYETNDPAIIPDLGRPMSGLVEAICSGRTWDSFDQDVREVTDRLAGSLGEWKPQG